MFGISSSFQPGGSLVRFDRRCLDPDQVVEEFGSAGELVVAVGQTAPEFAGGDVAGVDDRRTVAPSEPPVEALGADDVGSSGQVKLLFGSEDVLADPEVAAEADVVVDGGPDLRGECRSGACDDAAAAGPAKHVVGGRDWACRGGRHVIRPEVGDGFGQVLPGLAAEDAERIEAGEARVQPA
ncbi:hypothetical protein ACFT7S_30165 [Streptomyces sp. NPDC057136]|uniref:hypothetical protein n=1 Tax=Streptomyces sp. NPDC057136 TaxID=3346029 RepID=UPI003643A83C